MDDKLQLQNDTDDPQNGQAATLPQDNTSNTPAVAMAAAGGDSGNSNENTGP